MVEDVKSYDRFPDFRRFVIEPATKEIEEYTDITVSYRTITKGRKVTALEFFIKKKEKAEAYKCYSKTCNLLENK